VLYTIIIILSYLRPSALSGYVYARRRTRRRVLTVASPWPHHRDRTHQTSGV